jgi:hypothetical protein
VLWLYYRAVFHSTCRYTYLYYQKASAQPLRNDCDNIITDIQLVSGSSESFLIGETPINELIFHDTLLLNQ